MRWGRRRPASGRRSDTRSTERGSGRAALGFGRGPEEGNRAAQRCKTEGCDVESAFTPCGRLAIQSNAILLAVCT